MKWGFVMNRPEMAIQFSSSPQQKFVIKDCTFHNNMPTSTECKWCGAPKHTSCCEYCRRE